MLIYCRLLFFFKFFKCMVSRAGVLDRGADLIWLDFGGILPIPGSQNLKCFLNENYGL